MGLVSLRPVLVVEGNRQQMRSLPRFVDFQPSQSRLVYLFQEVAYSADWEDVEKKYSRGLLAPFVATDEETETDEETGATTTAPGTVAVFRDGSVVPAGPLSVRSGRVEGRAGTVRRSYLNRRE